MNCFALLNESPRPWLCADALKEAFLQRSAEFHPDRVHAASAAEKLEANRRYTELNTAYTTLREPRDRLRHLLEIERGDKPKDVREIPAAGTDLFFEIATAIRDVDAFLPQKEQVTSPLLKVRLFEQSLEWTEKLMVLQQKTDAIRQELSTELKSLNAAWEGAPPPGSPERPRSLPLDRVEQLYRLFSYTSRWTSQLQERIVQLSL